MPEILTASPEKTPTAFNVATDLKLDQPKKFTIPPSSMTELLERLKGCSTEEIKDQLWGNSAQAWMIAAHLAKGQTEQLNFNVSLCKPRLDALDRVANHNHLTGLLVYLGFVSSGKFLDESLLTDRRIRTLEVDGLNNERGKDQSFVDLGYPFSVVTARLLSCNRADLDQVFRTCQLNFSAGNLR